MTVYGALGIEIAIIFALTLANGFFSGSEIAIVSARRSRLEQAAAAGRRGARQALALSENPDRFLATVQVGISLIGTFAAAFGGARIGALLTTWLLGVPALAAYAEPLALAIVVAGITYLSLIVGELVPKRLGLRYAEGMAMLAAPIMNALAWIARPLVALLTGSVWVVLRLLGQHRASESPVTEEDIVYMVREGTVGGSVEAGEAQLIHRVFQFTDRLVRAVMTPRTEIISVEADTPAQEVLELFVSSDFSRIPVYKDTVDHVIGVLHSNDMLSAVGRAALHYAPDSAAGSTPVAAGVDILRIMRPPTFVLESQHVDDVLAMFRQQRTHFAVVIDEYGSVAGVLTLQDVLEELVGEVPEGTQGETEEGENTFVQRDDGSWLVDAMEAYDRVLEHVGMDPLSPEERGDFTSLAGLILERLGRIPSVGDKVVIDDYVLEVVDMDGQRIDKVLIRPEEERDRVR